MSKKRFDPKKLKSLESINDHIDLKKAQGFAEATINDILVGQTKLFTEKYPYGQRPLSLTQRMDELCS